MSCPHVANVLRVPTQILQKNFEIIGLLAKCNQHNFLMIYGIFCWKEHTSPKILLVYLFTVSVTKGKIAKAGPAWGSRRVKMWLQVMADVSTKGIPQNSKTKSKNLHIMPS